MEDARRRGAGQREYLKFQLTSMPPQTLLKCVYPHMAGWSSVERKVDDRLHLSRESMVKSGAPIVVLDAHDSIYVYYTAAARADADACPFPFRPLEAGPAPAIGPPSDGSAVPKLWPLLSSNTSLKRVFFLR